MNQPLRILIVEDSPSDAKLMVHELRRIYRDVAWHRVDTETAMREALRNEPWDAVISDFSMPSFNALAALQVLKSTQLDIPFVIVSGTIGEEAAVEAMRAGAHDYVLKDRLVRLCPVIERELRDAKERQTHLATQRALRASEEQLRRAQKMDAIGNLAGGIAHDFNNLLSVIISYCAFLERALPAQDPMAEDVRQIDHAAQRAAELTRRLLAFGRRQVLSPRVLSLNDTLLHIEPMLQRVIGEDIALRIAPAEDLGWTRVDPGQLEQVIMNLVANARDAMPNGGELRFETYNVTIGADTPHLTLAPGEYVALNVSDTGTGMDSELQARIFEPFFTTKDKDKGTGLGLAVVFGIVRQSGGDIEVRSRPDQGASFRIYLPRTEAPVVVAAQGQRVRARSDARGEETILVVEDENQVRGVTCTILERAGYRVLQASNGDDALQICEQHQDPIDLLLTDVVMPRMNGVQVAERARLLRPTLRVLYMSGYGVGVVVDRNAVGPDAPLLSKPITPSALTDKVRSVLDGH